MTKLYFVKLTYTAVVQANDNDHAFDVARWNAEHIVGDSSHHDAASVLKEIKSQDDLEDGWTAESYPYGGNCEKTIAQILSENENTVEASK